MNTYTFKNVLLTTLVCLLFLSPLKAAQDPNADDPNKVAANFESCILNAIKNYKNTRNEIDREPIKEKILKDIIALDHHLYKAPGKAKITRIEEICKRCGAKEIGCNLWNAIVQELINQGTLAEKSDQILNRIGGQIENNDCISVNAIIDHLVKNDVNGKQRMVAFQNSVEGMDDNFYNSIEKLPPNNKAEKDGIIDDNRQNLKDNIRAFLSKPEVILINGKYNGRKAYIFVSLITRFMIFFQENCNAWSFWTLKKAGQRSAVPEKKNQQKRDDGLIDLLLYRELNPDK